MGKKYAQKSTSTVQNAKFTSLKFIERTKNERSRNENEKKNADSVYAYLNY